MNLAALFFPNRKPPPSTTIVTIVGEDRRLKQNDDRVSPVKLAIQSGAGFLAGGGYGLLLQYPLTPLHQAFPAALHAGAVGAYGVPSLMAVLADGGMSYRGAFLTGAVFGALTATSPRSIGPLAITYGAVFSLINCFVPKKK